MSFSQGSPHPLHSTRLIQVVPSYNVLAQRKRIYIRACYLFMCFVFTAFFLITACAYLLFGGELATLWHSFWLYHPSFYEILEILVTITLFIYYPLKEIIQNVIEEYICIHAFAPLYERCRYIDPAHMILLRLPYRALLYPERFIRAFAGNKMIFLVEKQKINETAYSIVEEKMDEPDESINEKHHDTPSVPTITVVDGGPLLAKTTHEIEPEIQRDRVQNEHISLTDKNLNAKKEHPQDLLEHLSLIVFIEQTVSLSIEERDLPEKDGKRRVEVNIGENSERKALIGYLAIQREGQWVKHDVLKETLYGNFTSDKEKMGQKLYDSRRRVQKPIVDCIETYFPHYTPIPKGFTLFEQRGKCEHASWRLSPFCRVKGFHTLDEWYQKIQTRTLIRENDLLALAHVLIKHYSNNYLKKYTDHEAYRGGYLIENLEEEPFRNWAYGFFDEYRRKYIYVLTYIAERIYKLGLDKKKPDYIEQAANFYRECAYAATCHPINQAQGEKALRACIEAFMSNEQLEEAEMTYEVYAKRVRKVVTEFKPEPKTLHTLDRYNLSFES